MSRQKYDLIQQHAADEFAANDDAAVLSIMNDVTAVTIRKPGVKSQAELLSLMVAKGYSLGQLNTILAAIETGSDRLLAAFFAGLTTRGQDFSTTESQLVLARHSDDDIRADLMAIGCVHMSRAQQSLNRAWVQQDTDDARSWWANEGDKQARRQKVASAYNAIVAAIDADTVATDQQAIDMFESEMGG